MSTASCSSSSHHPSSQENNNDQLDSIEVELSQVEQELETPRRRWNGRASFNSVRSALGDIRNRLVERGESTSDLNQRLETAELAHSSRIPLGLLRGSSSRLMQRHRSSRASIVAPSSTTRHSIVAGGAASTRRSLKLDQLEEAEKEDRTIKPSTLVASRVLADQAQGFECEELHQSGTNLLLSPVREASQGSELSASDNQKKKESCKETPLLLSKRQSWLRSSGSLSGSVHHLEAEDNAASTVYSWGSGLQSLHDDDSEKTVQQAKLNAKSRIGRPGAPKVVSVATSTSHSACATAQGDVLLCGSNHKGQVDPNKQNENLIKKPTILESLGQTRVVQVSCGLNHTAALSENGSVLTWGSNEKGQLGHFVQPVRSKFDEPAPTVYVKPKAMSLGPGTLAAAVACGHEFTLVLTTRMSLLACGIDSIAGYGGSNKLPRCLPALEGLPLVAVAAGHQHAIALTSHGSAFAWGSNQNSCCGREYPETLSMPVPIHTPDTSLRLHIDDNTAASFPNWAMYDKEDGLSLADDVAIVHAACGDGHTVLVTKSGRLLVCGNNEQGQLGLEEKHVCPVQPIPHPQSNRKFVSAEAGEGHTLVLDDNGDVWQMGLGNHDLKCVLANKNILTIAAGGKESIAVAAGSGIPRPQFTPTIDPTLTAESLEELLEAIEDDPSKGQELANRTEELLRNPAVLNSLFLNVTELHHIYDELVSAGDAKTKQAMATAIEKGIRSGLEKLRDADARLMYPEAVRCLLLYLQFFVREDDEKEEIKFDHIGGCMSLLCETILGLSFEGYKAYLTWATTLYSSDLFVKMLVQPLLAQMDKGLHVDVDDDGVQHFNLSRRAVPMVVAVLRWLYKASERSDTLVIPQEAFYSKAVANMSPEDLYQDLARYKAAKKQNAHELSSHFFYCANPFLFSPSTKRNLLQIENSVEMTKIITSEVEYDAESGEYTIEPFFVLKIERSKLLEQTLEKIKETKPTVLRKKLRVAFDGEEGVDAGGVTKEFFQLLSEELFDVNSSLWTNRFGDGITWFNSDCSWDEEGYELVGVLVGLALYNGVLLDVRFPIAVYRKLLSLPLGLEDMVDQELKQGLQQLLDYPCDDVEDIFCLNFEVTWMDLDKERKVELKPGGADIPVTSHNKEEYVLLYVKWLLVDSIQPQWDAFEKGLMRVMESSSLDLFRPEELRLLVVGTPELDFDALEANTEYEGGYDKDSPVVKNFWRFVKDASRETQIQLLRFATGSSMAPIGGLGELKFKIQRAGPDSPQLPTSHTCFNTLLIPDYGEDYDKLAARLGRAILECEGFGLQ